MPTLVISAFELLPGANEITFGGDLLGFGSDGSRAYLYRTYIEGEELESYTTLDYLLASHDSRYDSDVWEPQYFGGGFIVFTAVGATEGEQVQLGPKESAPVDQGLSKPVDVEELKEKTPAQKPAQPNRTPAPAASGSTEKKS